MRVCWILAISLLIISLVSGCGTSFNKVSNFNRDIGAIIHPYTFNYGSWEFNALINGLRQTPGRESADTQSVIDYFSLTAQLDTLKSEARLLLAQNSQDNITVAEDRIDSVNAQIAALKPVVERTIALQINQILAERGIYNPAGISWFKLTFPPVNFSLESPLYELIISPRDRIEIMKSITIKPEITASQIQSVESSIDQLNVSSLIVQIGGLGATYPAFVANNASLRWTIETAAHEWIHQYLAFTRLGFSYILDLLGIPQNDDIGTINETVANIFGQEIGTMVYNRYYSQYQDSSGGTGETSPAPAAFDFNAAMRNIRRNVDAYLEQGQIDQAEKYMIEQQQVLAANGYYIRKLNQAYFAFHGNYADSPTSVNPIGPKLRSLRDNSPSIKNFLDTVAKFTCVQDLNDTLDEL